MSILTGSANAVKYTLFGFNLIFLVSPRENHVNTAHLQLRCGMSHTLEQLSRKSITEFAYWGSMDTMLIER